ncbi:MAG: Crp/Fnr family transcriptional regulator [Flavobacteriales bacterium]|nr:Crp/Fnr family transcriptional regulator [Flavobacteriales bacterium]
MALNAEHIKLIESQLRLTCPNVFFSKDLIQNFSNSFEVTRLKKGDLLAEEGVICKHFYLLFEGCVRFYHYRNGQEVSTSFFQEEEIFTGISFITQKGSDEYCEALEDLTIARMHIDKLERLYQSHLELNVFGRKMAERFLIWFDHRMHVFLSMSAKDRYKEFMESNLSSLFNRIPHKYIASYLGVTKETLSRIRADNY